MPLSNSDSHSRRPNVCNEQPFLSAVPVTHHVRFQDVVELGYTSLVQVFLVREPQSVLHVLANPLSELGWQVQSGACKRILQPYTVRRR